MSPEAHRIYAREYAAASRLGCSADIARTRARDEVERLTDYRFGVARRISERTRGGPRFKYHSDVERQAARKRSRDEAYARAKAATPTRIAAAGIPQPGKIVVPPDRLADAERIKYLSHDTIVGALMGDPLPGRSALDRMRT